MPVARDQRQSAAVEEETVGTGWEKILEWIEMCFRIFESFLHTTPTPLNPCNAEYNTLLKSRAPNLFNIYTLDMNMYTFSPIIIIIIIIFKIHIARVDLHVFLCSARSK